MVDGHSLVNLVTPSLGSCPQTNLLEHGTACTTSGTAALFEIKIRNNTGDQGRTPACMTKGTLSTYKKAEEAFSVLHRRSPQHTMKPEKQGQTTVYPRLPFCLRGDKEKKKEWFLRSFVIPAQISFNDQMNSSTHEDGLNCGVSNCPRQQLVIHREDSFPLVSSCPVSLPSWGSPSLFPSSPSALLSPSFSHPAFSFAPTCSFAPTGFPEPRAALQTRPLGVCPALSGPVNVTATSPVLTFYIHYFHIKSPNNYSAINIFILKAKPTGSFGQQQHHLPHCLKFDPVSLFQLHHLLFP